MSFAASCSDVRRDVLRMHVIANSDSDEDQILKLKVRDAVLMEGKEIFDGSLTSANAEKLLIPQKERLEETAREVIRKNGFDYDVRLEIGRTFSTRTYDDRITLPAGEYEAVRVIIGEGKAKIGGALCFRLCVCPQPSHPMMRSFKTFCQRTSLKL